MKNNKEKLKEDFEQKTIINYILDYFNDQQEEKDNEFYADTSIAYKELIKSEDISDEQKYFIKNKMSFFTYFMNGKSNLFVNPYILFDNTADLSNIDDENLDKHFKDKYEEYLLKLQEAHLKNGKLNGRRCDTISSMTKMLNKNYEIVKTAKSRRKYRDNIKRFESSQEKYNKKDLINKQLIDLTKLKIKFKDFSTDVNWHKIENLNIAILGHIEYIEEGTGVERDLNIYATKGLKDANYDVVFGNLDLASLDTQNFEGKYSKEKKDAEKVISLLLSPETIKSSCRFNYGYIGEAERDEHGKMKIVYDPYDETVASIVRDPIIEKINNYTDKSNNIGKGEKSEKQSER